MRVLSQTLPVTAMLPPPPPTVFLGFYTAFLLLQTLKSDLILYKIFFYQHKTTKFVIFRTIEAYPV